MQHLALLLACILSVEVFIRFNFLLILDSMLKVTKKVVYVIPNENISDHWKEIVVPAYSFKIMKLSLKILLILLLILSLFVLTDYFLNNFLVFTFSFFGIVESIILAFSYAYLKNLLQDE
jgi:hypothetical protein